jgi:hypothetical protein
VGPNNVSKTRKGNMEMKLEKHIKENSFPNLEFLCHALDLENLDEGVSGETFETLKRAADKLGFRLHKSETIFDYFKKMGRGMNDLLRTASLFMLTDIKDRFMLTDIKDRKTRAVLIKDAKKIIKKANKKEITAFLMQLDKATLGITSHLRHIITSVFGLELTTYMRFVPDTDYIEAELKRVREVMRKKGMSDDDILMVKDVEAKLKRNIKNQEVIDAINKLKKL